jgi:hypothetical protein
MFSQHALCRMQQRSTPAAAIAAVLAFGEARRRGHADVYFLSRRGRERAAEALGREHYDRIQKALDTYVVMGDTGEVITTAYRYRRFHF